MFKRLLIVFIFIFAISLSANVSTSTKAAEADETLTSYSVPFNRDIVLRGVFMGERFYFTVDEYWLMQKAILELYYTHTQLLNEELSAYTIFLNDYPFYTSHIKTSDEDIKSVLVDLPLMYLKEINELRIEFYSRTGSYMEVDGRITDFPCIDDITPANWAVLYKNSNIKLSFIEKSPTQKLSEYPYPFLRASNKSGTDNTIIALSDVPDESELSAAFLLAANLGGHKNSEDISLDVLPFNKITSNMKENNNIIFIGNLENMPLELNDKIDEELINDVNDGALLHRLKSPYNENNMLMIITANTNSDMLSNAIRALSNEDILEQLDTDRFILKTYDEILSKDNKYKNRLTLNDLGYTNGIYLNGPFRQNAVIGINLSKNRMLAPGTQLSLNMRYSENLNFKRALVTAYINEIPIGSKKLDKNLASLDTLTLTIPNNIFTGHYIELKVSFDLEIDDSYCTERQPETPWAYLLNDSYLDLPAFDEKPFMFDFYPWPFVKDGALNDLVLVVPDTPTASEITTMFNMVSIMGRDLQSNRGSLTTVFDSSYDKLIHHGNIVAIGSPERLSFIKNLNNHYWFMYDDSFSYFMSNEKRWLLESFSRELSTVQLFKSPDNPKNAVLIATSPDINGIQRVEPFLTQHEIISRLNGNATLIDKEGEFRNHSFEYPEKMLITPDAQSFAKENFVMIIFSAVVLFLLLLSLILYRRYRKRR